MFIPLSCLGMLILLLPFKMNCKVIWLSVWDVSKNDYTNTCISFDEGHSYTTRFRNAPRLSELLKEKKKKRNDKMESLCFRYRIGGWLSLRCSCSFRGWTGCLSSQRVALFHQQHRWSQWNDGKRQRSRSAGMRIWGSRVPGLTPVNTFVFSHSRTRLEHAWGHQCTCQIHFISRVFLQWTLALLEGRAQQYLYLHDYSISKK